MAKLLKTDITGSGGKSGKSGSNEADNTLRSKARARLLYLVSEGEVEAVLVDGDKSIYIDQTPVRDPDGTLNYEGVTYSVRQGLPDQAHITGVPYIETPISVGLQSTQSGAALVRTITEVNADAVRVIIRIPALAFQNKKGNIVGTDLRYELDVKSSGGAYSTVVINDLSDEKTTSSYQIAHRVALPLGGAPWSIRMRRITADSVDIKLQNQTWWDENIVLVEGKFTFPNSALVYLEIDAEKFGSSMPQISFLSKGIKIQIPSNYNPLTRVYTGIWSGTFNVAFSDNPAWILYDMIVNDRYGLGEFVSAVKIDKWSLYRIAQYCDELIPSGYKTILGADIMEPRFTFNGTFTTRQEAFKVLQDICSQFRGMIYWSLGQVFAISDMPSDPVKLATPANVIEGHFTYKGTSLKARHSVYIVQYTDPDDFYRQGTEVIINDALLAQYGWREQTVSLLGCTSRGQAHRYGRWALDTEQSETESVEYMTGWDHADLKPGDVFQISDPRKATVRAGGRIRRPDNLATDFLLDGQFYPTAGQTYSLTSVLPSGITETKAISKFLYYGRDKDGNENFAGQLNAVVGNLRTGAGVLPDGWSFTGDITLFTTCLLQAAGIDTDGLPYFDIRFVGTNSTGSAQNCLLNCCAGNEGMFVDVGQDYVVSSYAYITAGSGGNFERSSDSLQITTAQVRTSITKHVSNSDTNVAGLRFDLSVTAGQSVITTIRFKGAQIQPGTVPTVYVPSTGFGRVRLASAYAQMPIAGAVWAITGTDLTQRLYRALLLGENAKNQFNIQAIEHDPTKYARIELGYNLKSKYVTPPKRVAAAVEGLTLTQVLFYENEVSYCRLGISWSPPSNFSAKQYFVTYQGPEGSVVYGLTSKTYIEVNAKAGPYTVAVSSVAYTGKIMPATTVALTLTGWEGAALPNVTGLALSNSGSGTAFTSPDVAVVWVNNFPGTTTDISISGGADLYSPFYRDNQVRIYDTTSGDKLRDVYVNARDYFYSNAENLKDNVAFGRTVPSRNITVKINLRDKIGRISADTVLALTNAVPAVIAPVVNSNGGIITVSAPPIADVDYKGLLIWVSATSGFNPLVTTPDYDGPNSSVSIPKSANLTYYVRVGVYDSFGKTSLNICSEISVFNTSVVTDAIAPATPTGLAVTPGFKSNSLKWNANSEADLAAYQVYDLATATPAPTGGSTPTFVVSTTTMQHNVAAGAIRYYWIRAVDFAGNKSAWLGPQNGTGLNVGGTDITVTALSDITGNFGTILTGKIENGAGTGLLIDVTNNLIRSGTYTEDSSGIPIAGYRFKANGELKGYNLILSDIQAYGASFTRRAVKSVAPIFINGIPLGLGTAGNNRSMYNYPSAMNGFSSGNGGFQYSWFSFTRTPWSICFNTTAIYNGTAELNNDAPIAIIPGTLLPDEVVLYAAGNQKTVRLKYNGTIDLTDIDINGVPNTTYTPLIPFRWMHQMERDPTNIEASTKTFGGLGVARNILPVVVPTCSKFKIQSWGAGGGYDLTGGGQYGGPGGYTYAEFNVGSAYGILPGDILWVVLGEGGRRAYPQNGLGWGGKGSPEGDRHSGGGLTGVFLHSISRATALTIAGGGGAGKNGQNGSPGGHTTWAGGQTGTDIALMTGAPYVYTASRAKASGGGGYTGGGYLTNNMAGANPASGDRGGKGGTNFVDTSHAAYVASSASMQFSAADANGYATGATGYRPPNTGATDYTANDLKYTWMSRQLVGEGATTGTISTDESAGNGACVIEWVP